MVKEKDGYKYSMKSFPEYLFRYKFEIEFFDRRNNKNFDVYSDNPNREQVEALFKKRIEIVYPDFEKAAIINWSTKEQDDNTSEFIDEWLTSK